MMPTWRLLRPSLRRIKSNRYVLSNSAGTGGVMEYVLRNGADRGSMTTANYDSNNAVTLQYNELSSAAHAVIPID